MIFLDRLFGLLDTISERFIVGYEPIKSTEYMDYGLSRTLATGYGVEKYNYCFKRGGTTNVPLPETCRIYADDWKKDGNDDKDKSQ